MASKADFISRQRQATTRLIENLNELVALKRQYDALSYGNASTGLQDSDFSGTNADITLTEFKAGVNAAAEYNSTFSAGGTLSANIDAKLFKLKL